MKYLLIAAFSATLFAQTGRTVTLTWVDTQNPAGTTYNVKQAVGLCSGTPTYSTIATAVTVKTFVQTGVAVGNYCYVVTATVGGVESAPSNAAGATALPFAVNLNTINVAKADTTEPVIVAEVRVPLLMSTDLF